MNKNLWKCVLALGIAPFVIAVVLGVYHMWIESWALLDWLVFYSFLYWPTYLVGVVLIVLAAVKLKKQ